MKSFLPLALAVVVASAAPGRSLADTLIQRVSPEEAEEWGVSITTRPNGDADTRATLALKAEGKWEKFRGAE